jgi:hypothetical protein
MEQLDQDPSYAWVLGFLDEECLDALQHEDKIKLVGLCFKVSRKESCRGREREIKTQTNSFDFI